MHPIIITISLVCSIAYHIYLKGLKGLKFSILYMLPILILVILVNSLFTHEGETEICVLPWGDCMMLESVVFGIASGAMLVAVIQWFACFSAIISSEKFIYLFGKIIPSGSLILSSALRFIPLFTTKLRSVSQAQKGIGCNVSQGKTKQRVHNTSKILSIIISWSMENAIDTADSMKCRGYGLKNRTSFSIYKFNRDDTLMLIWIIFAALVIIRAWICGDFAYEYYPLLQELKINFSTLFTYLIYFIICISPLLINVFYKIIWKIRISNIKDSKVNNYQQKWELS
ncbi:MAG: energy-coupling factor transporter transmembrane protein EcfT [Coriobacteriales bacterium]|nr:energy-coupling factor transporter transmembrane protein EcfT [Coriobacteriales bacterium]